MGAGTPVGAVYTITGTPAAVSAALAAVTFDSAQDFNGTLSVAVAVTDGQSGPQGSNPTGSVSITVTAVNDAPTATNLTQTLTLAEDAAPPPLFTTAPTVADIDSGSVTATLTISNTAAGVLVGAGTPVGAVYTITGTPAAVNAALAAVTFDSAQDFNGTLQRRVADQRRPERSAGQQPDRLTSITVTAVNDAPTATNLTQTLTIDEDAAATALFTAAPTVADIDSASVTATLTISNTAAGVLVGAGYACGRGLHHQALRHPGGGEMPRSRR